MNTLFIQADEQQLLGAKVAKFAVEKHLNNKSSVDIKILNVSTMPIFLNLVGKTYLRNGRILTYTLDDLQAFTLSRIMPPELMGFRGRAVVIDPDVFFLADVNELFNMDMQGKAIACTRYHEKDMWESSLMLLDCAKLTHWKAKEILKKFVEKELDYLDIVRLRKETSILEIPRVWNSFDKITPETKVLHTTKRLTQPWKTGLPIDFTPSPMPKFFGIIPRELVHKLLGKYPTHYLPHPNKEVEEFFIALVRETYKAGQITEEEIRTAVEKRHVRADLFEIIVS
ncbi:MAG: hypothetical protein Q7R67_01885 [bacterium]|nr:hypothetical protein [bacterium]